MVSNCGYGFLMMSQTRISMMLSARLPISCAMFQTGKLGVCENGNKTEYAGI